MSRSHLLSEHCAPKAPRACRVSIPNPIVRGAIGENRRRIPLSANPIHEHDAILTRKPRAGCRQKNDAPSLQSKRWHDPQHRLPRPNLPTAEIHRRAGAIHERQELPTRHRVLRLQLNRNDLHPSTADCRCRGKHERRKGEKHGHRKRNLPLHLLPLRGRTHTSLSSGRRANGASTPPCRKCQHESPARGTYPKRGVKAHVACASVRE